MVRQGLCNVYTQLISVPSGINLHGIIIYTSQPLTWTRKACTLLENFADFCFIQRSKADGTYSYFRQNSLFWILNDYFATFNKTIFLQIIFFYWFGFNSAQQCKVSTVWKRQVDTTLLEKCWRISLYFFTNDAIAKLYTVCDVKFRQIEVGNGRKFCHIELSNSVISQIF